jgi:hypothetical protein
MYYRVAIQVDASPTWQWKSTTLSSLNAVFQFLRRFHDLPQERLRVFSSSEGDLGEQLATENNGLGSHSVTAAQFMQERGICSLQRPSLAVAPKPTLNESSRRTAGSSAKSSQAGRARVAGGADFWNIMAFVGA